jgi:hypothetical protein
MQNSHQHVVLRAISSPEMERKEERWRGVGWLLSIRPCPACRPKWIPWVHICPTGQTGRKTCTQRADLTGPRIAGSSVRIHPWPSFGSKMGAREHRADTLLSSPGLTVSCPVSHFHAWRGLSPAMPISKGFRSRKRIGDLANSTAIRRKQMNTRIYPGSDPSKGKRPTSCLSDFVLMGWWWWWCYNGGVDWI